MNPIDRLVSKFLIIASLAVTTGCSDWVGTTCAPQYSELGFKKVQAGMSVSDVKRLLGDPITVEVQDFHDEWIYRAKQPKADSVLGVFSTAELQVPPATHILFDSTGRVVSRYGNYLGGVSERSTKEQVKLAFGPPTQTDTRCAGQVYVYTKAKTAGDYRLRKVVFDTDGLVTDIVSFTYYD